MHRRLFVATFGTGTLATTAGCLDALDDATSFSASPAIVSSEQADDAGYEYQGTDETVETETVPGTDETVEVTNYTSEYTRPIERAVDILDIDDAEMGAVALITTPQVSVAGEEFNPVGDMSNAEIAGQIQDQYEEISIDESIGVRRVETLETTAEIETFEAEALFLGDHAIDVLVDIAQFDHDGDHLVIVGVYPDVSEFPIGDEADRIDTMIGGLEHGDGVDADIDPADG